jgi:hypothetical protein
VAKASVLGTSHPFDSTATPQPHRYHAHVIRGLALSPPTDTSSPHPQAVLPVYLSMPFPEIPFLSTKFALCELLLHVMNLRRHASRCRGHVCRTISPSHVVTCFRAVPARPSLRDSFVSARRSTLLITPPTLYKLAAYYSQGHMAKSDVLSLTGQFYSFSLSHLRVALVGSLRLQSSNRGLSERVPLRR